MDDRGCRCDVNAAGSNIRLLIWLIVFCMPLPTAGAVTADFEPVAAVYSRFIHLSARHNISPLATAIAQDRDGFLWLGTQHGLYRFDGDNVQLYRAAPDDSASLSADWVSALLVAGDGRLWIGTRYGGLNLYDPVTQRFSRVPLPPLILSSRNYGNTVIVCRALTVTGCKLLPVIRWPLTRGYRPAVISFCWPAACRKGSGSKRSAYRCGYCRPGG